MGYTKTTWNNGEAPAINATNLNKIEQGIYDSTYNNGLNVSTSVDNSYKVNVLKGKNLFDKNSVLLNTALDASTGGTSSNNARITSNYIKVKPNTEYIFSNANDLSTNGKALCYYNASMTFISGTEISSLTNGKFTTPANTKYIRFGYVNTGDYANIMLNEGETATTYEPYITPSINVNGDEIYNSNVMNYSTSEQRIGTWIDGKPLYRKIIKTTNVTNDLTSLNISEWVDIRIMALMSNGVILNIGRAESSSDYFSYYIYDNNKSININVGNTWTLSKATITLEYTKTTD